MIEAGEKIKARKPLATPQLFSLNEFNLIQQVDCERAAGDNYATKSSTIVLILHLTWFLT